MLAMALAFSSSCLLILVVDMVRGAGGSVGSYRGLAEAAWGLNAARGVDAVIALYTGGTLIAYGKLIVQFFSPPLEYFGVPAALRSQGFLIGAAVLVLVPLLSAKKIEKLKLTSLLGNVALAYAVGLVFFGWLQSGAGVAEGVTAIGDDSSRILQGLALTTGSWNFHYNLPMYYGELSKPSPKRMMTIIGAAYGTVACAYTLFITGGYLRFGSETQSNIINNLPDDNTATAVCRLLLGFMILATYPVVGFATRCAAARAITGGDDLNDFSRWMCALIVVVAPIFVSVLVPDIGTVLSVDGALFGVAQQLIIPSALFITLSGRAGGRNLRHYGFPVLLAGLVMAPLGFTGTVLTLLGGGSK